LQALETYTDLSPADPVGYIERFRQFMNKGDPEMAEAELIKIYARYPKFPNYHLYRGMSLNAQGKNDAAKEAFLKELENNAYNVDAYIYLGKTLLDQGKPGEALQPLNQALTISTEKPEAKRYAAIANLQLKNFQGASALLQSAIALDGGNPLNYRLLGNVYREMGDARNAAAAYRKYLELSPQAPDRNQVLPFIQ
jgi:tetratricopeptide (TPR) repeat protein